MLRIASLIVALLFAAASANAETVDVKYFGSLDLKTFDCIDVSRSSLVTRACYDKAKQFMVVRLKETYYPYCEMPAATYDAFLKAESMGRYFNANIKGTGKDGPYDCRTHRVPQY